MQNKSDELMSAIRREIEKLGDRVVHQREDIYPIALRLRKEMPDHGSASNHSLRAAVRCTMQRLVKEGRYRRVAKRNLYQRFSTACPNPKGPTVSKPIFKSRDFTLAQALSYPPYKGQRDSEKHRQQWLKDADFDPDNFTLGHTIVLASYMGVIYVMDGNTQLLMHREGDIKLPDNLPGLPFYYCSSEDQMRQVYESYNSARQTKHAGDNFFSAGKLNNIKFKSKFLSNGRGTSAVAFAEGARRGLRHRVAHLDHVEALEEWKTELKKLDVLLADCGRPGKCGTNAGILAAALLTLRREPTKAEQFWKLFFGSLGEGETGLPWVRLFIRAAGIFGSKGGGREATLEVVEIALAAFDHCADDVFRSLDLGQRFHRVACDTYLPEGAKAKAKAVKEAAKEAANKAMLSELGMDA